jgi:hypothetical protein
MSSNWTLEMAVRCEHDTDGTATIAAGIACAPPPTVRRQHSRGGIRTRRKRPGRRGEDGAVLRELLRSADALGPSEVGQ